MAIDDTLSLTDRIAAAETRILKAVFPGTTNHYDTLFGGTALQLMDEVAFIAATRFSLKQTKKARRYGPGNVITNN